MKPEELVKKLNSLPASQLFEEVFRLYKDCRFSDYSDEPDSDMLLFQYGVFDWGAGEYFELDITRQFIGYMEDISQLRATLYFKVTAELNGIGEYSSWCCSPAELGSFEVLVKESSAYKVCRPITPEKIEVTYGNV